MSILTDAQRAQFFEMRRMMDDLVAAIPATSEAEFNAAAAEVNDKAAAIRVWIPGKTYERGAIRVDQADGCPYWAMHTHNSVPGQELQPSLSPTIWAHCHGTTPETARPFVAEGHNPYRVGHYCTEDGKTYRCAVDNTVYAPSVYRQAWEEIT